MNKNIKMDKLNNEPILKQLLFIIKAIIEKLYLFE